MTTLDDLRHWSPVGFRVEDGVPIVEWCDLGSARFIEPFFDQTVARVATEGRCGPLVATGLDALLELDRAPSLEPCGMIFHASRCGSTLVSRTLGLAPGSVVVSEPAALNGLLALDPERLDAEVFVQVVRLMVRALGRIRCGDERHLVLKLSSWNVRRAASLGAAFPEAPMVWLQRDPAEILASLLAKPPSWAAMRADPAALSRLFGATAAGAAATDDATFFAAVLDSLFGAAGHASAEILDYDMLPEAIWQRVAPLFGIGVSAETLASMRASVRFDAKSLGKVRFDPGSNPATPAIRAVVDPGLSAQYRRLRRHSETSLPRSA